MIFESHAHYDDEAFNEDRETLLASMQENGIGTIINVGASIASTQSTIALTQQYPFLYGAAGVHPSETAELDEDKLCWLEQQCRSEKIVAVGEIGLDYHWPEPDRALQKYWFEKQLELAARVNLPLIIHSREAAKDTLDIIKAHHTQDSRGVIHCFSYTKEIAQEYISMGYYIGIGGVITFSNAKKLKEAAAAIPIEKILLETDCPYLAPVPNRGKRNSSLNLPYVAQEIAQIKGISREEVVSITCENAQRLFFG